jgi:hypothetical protein
MKLENGQSLDRILESAVIVSWPDLMKNAQAGLIHLEYAYALDGTLGYLKVWSSVTRGYWRLACAYRMADTGFHSKGIEFETGFRSEGLTQTLDFIMQHQSAFSTTDNGGRTGLLQIQVPTEEQSAAAAQSVKDAFCRVNSFSAEPSVA